MDLVAELAVFNADVDPLLDVSAVSEGDGGGLSFFVRRVITLCEPKLMLTILDPWTISIVLSECSEM